VASLNLAADEILVELLPPERLVAVTSFADDPASSNIVGRAPAGAARFQHADLERLLALRSDLVVVAEFTDADFLHLLGASGLRYHKVEGLDSFEGIRTAVRELGGAVGAEAAAQGLIERFDARLRELDTRLAGVSRPKVLYWSNPHVWGSGTVMDAVIEKAGAINAGKAMGVKGVLPVGAERAFLANPDVVLVAGPGTREALASHPLLSQLAAVRAGRVVELPGHYAATLTHYTAEAAWFLAHALHPERVPEQKP
jgi:iron complex transport system substrate-binding protein